MLYQPLMRALATTIISGCGGGLNAIRTVPDRRMNMKQENGHAATTTACSISTRPYVKGRATVKHAA